MLSSRYWFIEFILLNRYNILKSNIIVAIRFSSRAVEMTSHPVCVSTFYSLCRFTPRDNLFQKCDNAQFDPVNLVNIANPDTNYLKTFVINFHVKLLIQTLKVQENIIISSIAAKPARSSLLLLVYILI